MTDATMGGGRGGVGIRIYVNGGEVVKRTLGQIGDSGKKMWAEIALGAKSGNPAIRALSIGVDGAKAGISDLAARAGTAGTALASFGAAGVTLAAVLGALAIATTASFSAMRDAADLTDAADRVGVSATALQEWKFVADEAGVSAEAFQANVEKLNGVLGAFKLGIGDAKLKPVFEELGITKEQLDQVQTADQLMLLLADTLGQVQDRALQVKLARSLGIEESLPLIRLGSEEILRLRNEAHELGVVLNDDVRKRLDEADRQMEISGQQMKVLRDTAVAPLASAFADATTYLANLAVEFSSIEAKAPSWIQTLSALTRALPGVGAAQRAGEFVVGRIFQGRIGTGSSSNQDAAGDYDFGALKGDLGDLAAGTGAYGSTRAGYEPQGHSSRGAGRSGGGSDKAGREAEQRLQRQQRADDQRARLDADIARELEGEYRSIQDRHNFALDRLDAEAKARDLAIQRGQEEFERSKGLRGISDAEAAILREKEGELLSAKRENERQRELHAVAARQLEDAETAADHATGMLDIEVGMARTASERARVQREILVIEQKIARDRLKLQLENDKELNDGDVAGRLSDYDRRAAGELNLFDHEEGERLRDQFKSAGREVVEAIREGRIGDLIADRLKSRLADMALDGLFDFMGGGKKGGSNFLTSAFKMASSVFGGGRASGGDVRGGYTYRMAEHGAELALFGTNGQVMNHAETARMVRDLAGAGEAAGGAQIAPVINMPPITIYAEGADAAGLKRVEAELRDLNRNLERRAVTAVAEYQQRSHGG